MEYDKTSSPLYKLLLGGKQINLPKGQVVSAFEDRAMLHLIKSGYIKRYLISSDGTKGIQVIFGPNDIVPLTPVYKTIFKMEMYSGPVQYYYEAMTDIKIYSVSQSTLLEAIEKDPLIYRDLFYAAGMRLNSYIHRLESMSTRAAHRKVAHQLAYLAEVFGVESHDGIAITVPLTHQNIGDMLNLARETVTHCMNRLQEKGLITGGKHIVVLDLEKLKLRSSLISSG